MTTLWSLRGRTLAPRVQLYKYIPSEDRLDLTENKQLLLSTEDWTEICIAFSKPSGLRHLYKPETLKASFLFSRLMVVWAFIFFGPIFVLTSYRILFNLWDFSGLIQMKQFVKQAVTDTVRKWQDLNFSTPCAFLLWMFVSFHLVFMKIIHQSFFDCSLFYKTE